MSKRIDALSACFLLFLILANPLIGKLQADEHTESDLEQEIMQTENTLLRAVLERDGKTLQRLLSNDVLATGTTGMLLNKSQLIEKWTQHDSQIVTESSEISDAKVRVYGITAIVNETITDEHSDNRGNHKTVTRVTDVWVKVPAGWQLAASHESQLEQ